MWPETMRGDIQGKRRLMLFRWHRWWLLKPASAAWQHVMKHPAQALSQKTNMRKQWRDILQKMVVTLLSYDKRLGLKQLTTATLPVFY
jgi:hypothetical protein